MRAAGRVSSGLLFALAFLLLLYLSLQAVFNYPSFRNIAGMISMAAVILCSLLSLRNFLMVMFALKPFVDLTWDLELIVVAGLRVNPLSIVGLLVFFVVLYHYMNDRSGERPFNERHIWVFLAMNVAAGIIAIVSYDFPFAVAAERLVKLFDAYLIYFVATKVMSDEADRRRMYAIIWLSTLAVSLLSVAVYFTGSFNIDVTGGVARYAGLYNDSGSPAYNAVIMLVFGSLLYEKSRQEGHVPWWMRAAFWVSLLAAAQIMLVTITKSALMMLIVFLVMWVGLYKRRTYIIVPIVILCGYYLYTFNEDVRQRWAHEARFLTADEFTYENARRMGTGRVTVWGNLLKKYAYNYTFIQKIIGTYQDYKAHNQYLAYLMRLGLAGLAVFLVLYARFYQGLHEAFRRRPSPDVYMSKVLLMVFFFYGLTGHPFDYTTMLWYLMIMLSLINVFPAGETEERGGS